MFFWKALKTSHLAAGIDAFQQGVSARAAGKRISDNPHCLSTEAYTEWAEGWRATLDLDEDDDMDSCRDKTDRLT